jgi:hypothetical protein
MKRPEIFSLSAVGIAIYGKEAYLHNIIIIESPAGV